MLHHGHHRHRSIVPTPVMVDQLFFIQLTGINILTLCSYPSMKRTKQFENMNRKLTVWCFVITSCQVELNSCRRNWMEFWHTARNIRSVFFCTLNTFIVKHYFCDTWFLISVLHACVLLLLDVEFLLGYDWICVNFHVNMALYFIWVHLIYLLIYYYCLLISTSINLKKFCSSIKQMLLQLQQ